MTSAEQDPALGVAIDERTAIWMNERPSGYDQLQWVRDRELLSPLLFLMAQRTVDTYVDLGTGTGAVLSSLAPMAQRAIGLDISREMLGQAVVDSHVSLIQADACRYVPLPDKCADLVTERMMLHDLVDPGLAIQEAWRIVKPGGQLILSENVVDLPNPELRSALQSFLAGLRQNSPIGDQDFYHDPSQQAVDFIRSLFVLKREPNRFLWTGNEFAALVKENCPDANNLQLAFSLKFWDVANWLEKSGFPVEDCKQPGIAYCLGAREEIKDEWGIEITCDGQNVPRESHLELLGQYEAASREQREAMGINAFLYAAFANVSVRKVA